MLMYSHWLHMQNISSWLSSPLPPPPRSSPLHFSSGTIVAFVPIENWGFRGATDTIFMKAIPHVPGDGGPRVRGIAKI